MSFLSSVGLASGEAFVSTAFSIVGLKAMVLAALVTIVIVLFALFSRMLDQSETRSIMVAQVVKIVVIPLTLMF